MEHEDSATLFSLLLLFDAATNTYTSGGTAVMDTQKQDTEGFILLPVFSHT